ncbi:MAG: hypothetical protein LBG77_07530 [Dysgonamonadaceae bacterium]|jgi:hypothetical protein|nr:hypothetical protein [Dysgonamonadaceae bacterium]
MDAVKVRTRRPNEIERISVEPVLMTFTPLTQEDLLNRACQSIEDIRFGRVYTQEEIEVLSESW